MSGIERGTAAASGSRTAAARGSDHDLVIVGGGIYGACLALEAARRGLRPVLVEKRDFGSGTSSSSLGVLHGGLRYLQSADIGRTRTSIRERRWFCRSFPDLVRPLPCLMPLYGRGLRRPAVLRAALLLNDVFSARRNRGVSPAVHLPAGAILSPAETRSLFPGVPADGLEGAALWHDAVMTDPQRILLEILRWAVRSGATILDHVEAVSLRRDGDRVAGVEAVDHATGSALTLRAPVVVNCAGPWSADVADAFGSPAPGLFTRALAFNLLLTRAPLSKAALALEPGPGRRMLFLLPWHGRILAGTYHAPWTSPGAGPAAAESQVEDMLADINRALPSLNVRRQDVAQVLAGFVPAAPALDGTPSTRPVFLDHARQGGPPGLYSVVGVKYTTARDVAERAVKAIFGQRPLRPGSRRDAWYGADPVGSAHG